MADIEQRLKELEEWQRKWKHYFWLAVVVVGLAGTWFGLSVSSLHRSIGNAKDDLEAVNGGLRDVEKRAEGSVQKVRDDLETMDGKLGGLERKANDANTIADRAMTRAGDLDFAVSESKKASIGAKDAANQALERANEAGKLATNAQEAVEGSIKASQESAAASARAEEAAKRVEAIANVTEAQLRKVELIVDYLQKAIAKVPKPADVQGNMKVLPVILNGTSMIVTFVEGPCPYDRLELNQPYYTGTVYVPKGYMAKVTGTASYGTFKVSKELRGRVINNLQGSSIIWKDLD